MSNFPITLSSFLAIRDVEDYIEEWLNFYLLQGVQKFIIYDYGSQDNTPNLIKPYLDRGIVEYSYFTERYLEPLKSEEKWFEALSLKHRLDVIEKYRDFHKWMCFFDLDEFVFTTDEVASDDLKKFLNNINSPYRRDFPAIAVNWTIFGDSGEISKKDDYVISRFNKRSPLNCEVNEHCKVICQPAKVDVEKTRLAPNPHFFYYKNNSQAVNDHFITAGMPRYADGEYHSFHPAFSAYPEKCKLIRCNHYYVKSKEEYQEKTFRHEAMNNKNYAETEENLKIYNSVEDNSIKKYIPLLNCINLDNYSV